MTRVAPEGTIAPPEMTTMPLLLGKEHAFKVRLTEDLPDVWKGTQRGFLEECAIKLSRPIERLKAEVLFELPECLLSREYQLFLVSQGRSVGTDIGAAITNVDDFAAAHGKGSIKAAIHHLQNHGYPCHFMCVCIVIPPASTVGEESEEEKKQKVNGVEE